MQEYVWFWTLIILPACPAEVWSFSLRSMKFPSHAWLVLERARCAQPVKFFYVAQRICSLWKLNITMQHILASLLSIMLTFSKIIMAKNVPRSSIYLKKKSSLFTFGLEFTLFSFSECSHVRPHVTSYTLCSPGKEVKLPMSRFLLFNKIWSS